MWVLCSLHADRGSRFSGFVATPQAERLEQLHAQASVQFDLSNQEHQVKLAPALAPNKPGSHSLEKKKMHYRPSYVSESQLPVAVLDVTVLYQSCHV